MKGSNNKPLVELEEVTKIYKTRATFFGSSGKDVVALNQVSLKIMRGEIFGLVGESGSGKTTAGRLIVKLEEPESGRICLDNKEIAGLKGKALKDYRRKVQMIFQDPYQSLNPQRSVLDTVSEPVVIYGVGKGDVKKQLVWLAMESAGLSPPGDFLYRYPHQLSGGQRQRVAIARAMVLNPEFVVADEPTSMLDASISAQIFNILLHMREKHHITLLFITHSLAAARYLCDRIAVIYKGNLMEIGPAERVIHSPKHPYTQALLDALPRFGNPVEATCYGTLRGVERETFGHMGCAFFSRCKRAHRVKCSRESPALTEVSPSHSAACFYVEQEVEVGES
ncbi:MAG: ABC transporter ATP-binding protein [Deltaproteobacteria bacterium]|nr:ABC transporter ATP-binding protein [Deltaproteobacteria bacterium]